MKAPWGNVRSLGYRTTLSLLEQAGSTVDDRGDHVLVSTESNPDFWWGNFMLLHDRPSADQALEWVARFEEELPWAAHRAFGLDDPHAPGGALSAFAQLGYQVERSTVMTAEFPPNTGYSSLRTVQRLLIGDHDWEQHLALSLQVYPEPAGGPASDFARKRAMARRRLVEAGAGLWVGAFVDGQLVSQLGILKAGPGLARYQDVETHPDCRRRGLAGALVGFAGRLMLRSSGVSTLVMVADPDDEAIRLYRSLGFNETEHQIEASHPPR